jgi:outer membrane immunogenic protein
MGSRDVSFNGTAAFGGGFSRIDNIRQDVDMGTVRLNYTFGGPAVSRY